VEREALLAGDVQPGGRPAAPPPLALVQAFVNTVDRENGPDLLDNAAGFAEWLAGRGLASEAPPASRDLARARAVREALRALLWAHVEEGGEATRGGGAPLASDAGGDEAPALATLDGGDDEAPALATLGGGDDEAPALATLEAAAARARLRPDFATGALAPQAGGVDGALGAILAATFTAIADGTFARLKACPGDRCGWAFYDRSPTASATWCSMRVCGGRTKARAYYRRRTAR
jgi:predicted RNA-binding Zn ribbon-like protein